MTSRHKLSIEQEKEIQQKFENGVLANETATEYGISISGAHRLKIEMRNMKYEKFDKRLYKWYLEWNASGKISTYELLYKQALEIALSFGESFVSPHCLNKWLQHFIHKYRIMENLSSSSEKEHINWLKNNLLL